MTERIPIKIKSRQKTEHPIIHTQSYIWEHPYPLPLLLLLLHQSSLHPVTLSDGHQEAPMVANTYGGVSQSGAALTVS